MGILPFSPDNSPQKDRKTPPTPGVHRRTVLGVAVTLAPVALTAGPTSGAAPVLDPHAVALYEAAKVLYGRYTAATNQQAQGCLAQALALEPTFARAWALSAATERQAAISTWTDDWAGSMRQADTAALKAVTLARAEPGQPALPATLEQLGFVRIYQGRHEEAIEAAQEAMQHAPGYANAYGVWALALSYLGQPLDALTQIARHEALHPHPVFMHAYHRGHACVSLALSGADHAWDRAVKYLQWALRERPDYRPARSYLAATLMALGDGPGAGAHTTTLAQMGRPSPFDPRYALWFRRANPFQHVAVRERLITLWQEAEQQRPGGAV
jgi:tetratricopeptide (TPR) repeat protein